jgi:hypothetical protein
MEIMLRGNAVALGARPDEKMLVNKSGARDGMIARYIRLDTANVAYNFHSEKRDCASSPRPAQSAEIRPGLAGSD